MDADTDVTVVDAAPRPGGLVSDSFLTPGGRRAEAGQHGFWDEYHNIFALLDSLKLPEDPLTGYAEQGQYSPQGLEAVWPVYRDQKQKLPTGLGQALYTRFLNLPLSDLATAAPLVLAFSEFDGSEEAYARYDKISFYDLCVKLGVSRRMYDEAFEPMVLTGLFAPGNQCSASAALGMAYFFVLKHQTSFDVRWCRGNVGEKIFAPWVEQMAERGVTFVPSTRATGFVTRAQRRAEEAAAADDGDEGAAAGAATAVAADDDAAIAAVRCEGEGGVSSVLEADEVVFAVGAAALAGMVRGSPELSQHAEWRRYARLRGTGVLATRLFLDRTVETPYSANAVWGFDRGVGMTWFDITKLHGLDVGDGGEQGSVIEVDFYHAQSLLVMSDEQLVAKAKANLDTMLGADCAAASVVDAAVVRLPQAVNWYCPGSYDDLPSLRSEAIPNAYFVGDLVKSSHGSWSQEKAYVTGIEAANAILGKPEGDGIVPLDADEPHVKLGRDAVAAARRAWPLPGKPPSLADFLW